MSKMMGTSAGEKRSVDSRDIIIEGYQKCSYQMPCKAHKCKGNDNTKRADPVPYIARHPYPYPNDMLAFVVQHTHVQSSKC